MSELYNTVFIFLSSGLLLSLGLMLLFTAIADRPLLGNYRKARYLLAAAYLFYGCLNLSKSILSGSVSDIPLLKTITLAIAVSQAFLFTLSMFALLEVKFPGWRSIFREVALVAGLIATDIAVYALCPEGCFDVAFLGVVVAYALLLIRYTVLFARNYRRFRRRMENYYSGNEADRLRWVVFSFFAALSIGVMALCTTVFMYNAVMLAFTAAVDIFYTLFAIRFINYALRFRDIEEAMENAAPEPRQRDKNILLPAVAGTIEAGLKSWTVEKLFLAPGVTISDVSRHIGTNDKYLSLYINKHLDHTFREWIGRLRIDEAKRLMLDNPDMTIAEIASCTGFATKSHFGQQFRSITGFSPSHWRQQSSRPR